MLGTEHELIAAGAAIAGILGKSLQLRWANGHSERNGRSVRTGCPLEVQRNHAEMLIRHDQTLYGDRGIETELQTMRQQLTGIEKTLATLVGK